MSDPIAIDSKIALLAGAIDYAGTFPPAALPLDQALHEATSFRQKALHAWLSFRMTLPLKDLDSLLPETLLRAGGNGTAWIFTALGNSSESLPFESALNRMREDVKILEALRTRGAGLLCPVFYVAYETKVGSSFVEKLDQSMLQNLTQSLEIDFYFELVPNATWRDSLAKLAERLTQLNRRGQQRFGLKIRTGGNSKPSVEDLAHFLEVASHYKLLVKATQGLHHAVTHKDEFGFVNLFSAVTLLQSKQISKQEILACLLESDATAFRFDRDHLHWRNRVLSLTEILKARDQHRTCFGSCSLQEPDESLSNYFPSTKEFR